MSDLINREDAVEVIYKALRTPTPDYRKGPFHSSMDLAVALAQSIPSAEPTLYGYKIEHLAYIARAMQKEGVTAEYAVRTFDDMSRAIKMIIEEAQQKVEETLNERFNKQAGGD